MADSASILSIHVPPQVKYWWELFEEQKWNGSLTVHFNNGTFQSLEPKPNIRR